MVSAGIMTTWEYRLPQANGWLLADLEWWLFKNQIWVLSSDQEIYCILDKLRYCVENDTLLHFLTSWFHST